MQAPRQQHPRLQPKFSQVPMEGAGLLRMSTSGKRAARKRRGARRLQASRSRALPRAGMAAERAKGTRPQKQSKSRPSNRVPAANAGRDTARDRHRNLAPKARNMNVIDFLTYVVSSPLTSFIFVMILYASAILVAAIALAIAVVASHVHIGVTVPFTNAGLTVGLTSAGTVIVAATAWAIRKGRRAALRQEDETRE
jgi:hypothetical protein